MKTIKRKVFQLEKKIQLIDLLNSLEKETEIKKKIEENLNKLYDQPTDFTINSNDFSSFFPTSFSITSIS